MPKRNSGPSLDWREERQVWEIVWYERGRRRRRTTGTSDRNAASKLLAEFLLATEPVSKLSPQERRIDDSLTDYLTAQDPLTQSTITAAQNAKVLLGFWSGRRVAEITEETCLEYTDKHRAGRAKGTVSRELTTLAAALNLDVRKGRLTTAPHVWKPGQSQPRDIWLTRREAAILIWFARKTLAKHYLPFTILFLLYTSPRKTAALTLRWPQVDLVRGLIDFNPPGRARNKKGRAIIPISNHLMSFLRRRRKKSVETGFVIHDNGRALGSIRKSCTSAGEKAARYCERRAADERSELVRQDWLESARRLRATTPHVLRHTCITWLAQADVPFGAIAQYAGHSSSRTTERVYAHHSPSYLNQVIKALNRR